MSLNIQDQLFDRILQQYNKRSEAVDHLCKLLSVGKDAVYRRLRGESLISPDEIEVLARHYHLSIDRFIFKEQEQVRFTYSSLNQQVRTFDQYLEEILEQMMNFLHLPEQHFYYCTKDIPIFTYMYFPELIRFKLYIWGWTTFGFEFLENKPFHFDLVPYPTLKLAEQIAEVYNQMPSTELWNLSLVENTLHQIEYLATIGQFQDPEDALTVCDALGKMVLHCRNMAEAGSKGNPGGALPAKRENFHLYHNELVSTNNIILVESDTIQGLFTVFGNPNFLFTTDEQLLAHTKQWLEKLIAKSNSLSRENKRQREWFFNRLDRRIAHTRNRLESQLEDPPFF